MPVAYLITSYKLPEQLLRLVSLLREGGPDARIFVHHDDRQVTLDGTGLEAQGVDRILPASPVAWGEASQLAMLLRSVRWMLDRADFDWLVSLSGQDYPIRPVPEIEQSLMTAAVDGFIETRRCDRPALGGTVDEFAGRYHFRWRRVPRAVAAPLSRAGARAGSLVRTRVMPSGHWVGVRALRSPFDARLVCYSGSDWFTLSRRAVESLDQFARARPDVLRYYRRTLIPTESFFQTALANDFSLRLSGDYRRYVAFDDAHPRVLGVGDLEAMLASGGDFARKFDPTVDRQVLDELDRQVHARIYAPR